MVGLVIQVQVRSRVGLSSPDVWKVRQEVGGGCVSDIS